MGAQGDRCPSSGIGGSAATPGTEWYRWGPYVSERQWGTVRENYSADGNAWDSLPHDQARSRAYRSGDDGWPGSVILSSGCACRWRCGTGGTRLKAPAFGLTGPQGNHGEDVKEYWWYLDAVPGHAWNRWRYHYPQGACRYQDLLDVDARRGRYRPEYGCSISARPRRPVLDHRGGLRQRGPDDLLMSVQVTDAGPETETLACAADSVVPEHLVVGGWGAEAGLRGSGDRSVAIGTRSRGRWRWLPGRPGWGRPRLLFCENETNFAGLCGGEAVTPYPKDGVGDHVTRGAATVNPVGAGTNGASRTR